MGSASANGINLHLPPKPPKRENQNPNSVQNPSPDPNPNPNPNPNPIPMAAAGEPASPEEAALGQSEFLSREEVLGRRSLRLKQLEKVYRHQYWAMVEEMRAKHRDYYWEFGKSPLEEGEGGQNGNCSTSKGEERKKCAFNGCKSKAMPLTRFCHQHILSDNKQTLYRGCGFVTRSSQSVQITCAKPVLRATVPCLCPMHFQKIQKQVAQALKKAGLNVSSSAKLAPNFHVLVSECVKEIQSRRRKSLLRNLKSDKPSASSMKTTDRVEPSSICNGMPLPVERYFSALQDNDTEGKAESKPNETPICYTMTTS